MNPTENDSAQPALSAAPGSASDSDCGQWGDKPAQLRALGLTLDSARALCSKMDRTGGWRTRADLKTAIEDARMSLSASQAYFAAKNWNMVLLELSDAAFAMEEIKAALLGKPNVRMSEGADK